MGMGREIWIALRGLRRHPLSAAAAVGVLGLGIGLCAFMFSLVYGAVYRGLGLPDEDRVVALEVQLPEYGSRNTRLAAQIAGWMEEARGESERTDKPARRFSGFEWRSLDSWSRARRVIAKAAWLPAAGGEGKASAFRRHLADG